MNFLYVQAEDSTEADYQTSAVHLAAGTGDIESLTQYLEPGLFTPSKIDK